MKIAIFGATGGTGLQATEQALLQGHEVRALVRTPAKMTLQHPHLTVVHGDVLDPVKVRECLKGTAAAIVSLGNTPNNPDMIVSRGTRVIVDAMQEMGIRRLIVVTSLGTGDSADQVPFFFKALMKTVLKKAMEDKEAQEAIVMDSGLDWIIVRPGGLTDGPRTDAYTAGTHSTIQAGQVSRADVAAFLLRQLEDDTYLQKTPAITGG